jgi:hypothetical protein
LTNNTATGGNGGSGGNGGNGGGGLSQGGNGGHGGNGASGFGGAVYNISNLVVQSCTIANNRARGGQAGAGGTNGTGTFDSQMGIGGAGANGSGGGIYNGKNLNVRGCTLSFNAAQGGSSAAGGSQANGTGTTGAAGADGTGGGVWTTYWGLMTNCTVYSNTVTGGNGGNGGDGSGTLSTGGNGGNGGSGWGGGVFNSGTLSVANCTISTGRTIAGTNGAAGNGSFDGSPGQMGQALGGNIARSGGTFNLVNSILAASQSGGNGFGTITDLGHNLSSDASIPLTGAGSAVNIDPKLGPLAMNGGPTLTMRLLAGSPAINRVPPAAALNFDQRGYPRPLPAGGLSDIGAVEYEFSSAPVIVQHATDLTVLQGGSATFTILAIGAPTLLYQWDLNGEDIPGATRSTYTISNADTNNAGPGNGYNVRVRNSLGDDANGIVHANLVQAPSIVVAPTNLAVLAGNSATFTVTATGSQPLSYQWQFQGHNISGQTRSAYTIQNAQTNNIGSYNVVIANGFGSITSPSVTLNLLPTILSQPTSLAVLPGTDTNFTVQATGSPTLGYQWRFNGTNISGATTSQLSLTNLHQNNSGSYNVVVSNPFGQTNSTATLAVALPYAIAGRILDDVGMGLAGVTVTAGTNSTLTDITGFYVFSQLQSNLYTVTPLSDCYLFNPSNQVVTVGGDISLTNTDFTATHHFRILSGVISNSTGGLSTNSFTVLLSGTNRTGSTVLTNGAFAFSDLCPGTYTISPSSGVYAFNPPSITRTVPPDDTTLNFVASPGFTIGGQVTNALGAVRVHIFTASSTNDTSSDVAGHYNFGGLAAGVYSVAVEPARCHHFQPASWQVVVGPNATNINFNAVQDAYVIAGQVVNGVAGVSNVTVTLSGTNGQTAAMVTGVTGQYGFSNLCGGAYTLTVATANCYRLTPSSQAITLGPTNALNVTFSAAPDVYSVSGYVTAGGSGVSGVTLQISGLTNATRTDANGFYAFPNLCPGTYTLAPSLYCERFNPTSRVIQVGPSLTQVNFSAFTNDVFTISGKVTTNGVDGLPGVSVGDGAQTVVTDATGNYLLTHVCPGPVSVVPSLDGYGFTPGVSNLTLVANMAGVNFVSFPAFEIGGAVYEIVNGQTNQLRGITLNISHEGQNLGNVMTEDDGGFEIRGLAASTNAYIITPLDHCWLFQPTNLSIIVGPDADDQDFIATHDNVHSISGNISDGGVGVGNVLVQATRGGLTLTTTTDPSGNYSFPELCSEVYTITPTQSCLAFFPPSQTVVLTPDGQDAKTVNFSSYPNAFTVRGTITNTAGGGGLPGVIVTGGGLSSTTDANGNYVLTPLCPENIIVIPDLEGYGFAPPTSNLTITADLNGINFAAFSVFNITGAVYEIVNRQTNLLRGITLNVSHNGQNLTNVTTADDGGYEIRGLPASANAYIVTPQDPCWIFQLTSIPVVVGPSTNGVDFIATNDMVHAIGGKVSMAGMGLSNVLVLATFGAQTFTNTTDANGNYSFVSLCSGDYNLAPYLIGLSFYPASETLQLLPGGPDATLNFTAYQNGGLTVHLDTNGLLQLSFVATPGPNYQVEGSTDLLYWQTIFATNVTALTNVVPIQFTDPAWTNYPARFYRLRQ